MLALLGALTVSWKEIDLAFFQDLLCKRDAWNDLNRSQTPLILLFIHVQQYTAENIFYDCLTSFNTLSILLNKIYSRRYFVAYFFNNSATAQNKTSL